MAVQQRLCVTCASGTDALLMRKGADGEECRLPGERRAGRASSPLRDQRGGGASTRRRCTTSTASTKPPSTSTSLRSSAASRPRGARSSVRRTSSDRLDLFDPGTRSRCGGRRCLRARGLFVLDDARYLRVWLFQLQGPQARHFEAHRDSLSGQAARRLDGGDHPADGGGLANTLRGIRASTTGLLTRRDDVHLGPHWPARAPAGHEHGADRGDQCFGATRSDIRRNAAARADRQIRVGSATSITDARGSPPRHSTSVARRNTSSAWRGAPTENAFRRAAEARGRPRPRSTTPGRDPHQQTAYRDFGRRRRLYRSARALSEDDHQPADARLSRRGGPAQRVTVRAVRGA